MAPQQVEALPGGFKAGELVNFTGSSETLGTGDRITHGEQCEVLGYSTGDDDDQPFLTVKFANALQKSRIRLGHLSRAPPPPLPGGFHVRETLFFTGATQTLGNGDRLIHGKQCEVLGPSDYVTGDDMPHLTVQFPDASDDSFVALSSLSRTPPPPLQGGFQVTPGTIALTPSCPQPTPPETLTTQPKSGRRDRVPQRLQPGSLFGPHGVWRPVQSDGPWRWRMDSSPEVRPRSRDGHCLVPAEPHGPAAASGRMGRGRPRLLRWRCFQKDGWSNPEPQCSGQSHRRGL